jgi:hypothetical protein
METANGCDGGQVHDHGEQRARALLEAGLQHFGLKREELVELPKGDWRKALLATMIQRETTMKLDWISGELAMGTRAGTCRLIADTKRRLETDRRLRKSCSAILEMSTFYG